MDSLVFLIPMFPLLAAVGIGLAHLFSVLGGEQSEMITAKIAVFSITTSMFLALFLLLMDRLEMTAGSYSVGIWLNSGDFNLTLNFISSGFNIILAVVFNLILLVIFRFSVNYMHREAGFHRFFFMLCLFAFAMLLLVLSGNAVATFVGWELAGLCSYLLIAYAYDRPVAAHNATRVFVTNRIGDAGFILGIGLSFLWLGSLDWGEITQAAGHISVREATTIALCFALAAFAKSAQIPFTPWLSKAVEGPTPSSAVFYGGVMIHSGVYLTILLRPLFEQAPFAMLVLAVVGLLTAVYATIIGLTQTDIKSSLIFATSAQLGLMFLECGLGFWQLAAWHLCAHAVVRCYQLLTAPSLMHFVQGNPVARVSPLVEKKRWIYMASVQRFWLDQISDWVLVRPIRRLAQDLSYFDDHIIDRVMGIPAPAIRAISSLAQQEEKKIGAQLDNDEDRFARGSGLAGKLTEWVAAVLHWFEDYFVLQGIGKGTIDYGRELGHAANKVEQLLLRPRYLALFLFITLLVAF